MVYEESAWAEIKPQTGHFALTSPSFELQKMDGRVVATFYHQALRAQQLAKSALCFIKDVAEYPASPMTKSGSQ